jgi:hypothetical protein
MCSKKVEGVCCGDDDGVCCEKMLPGWSTPKMQISKRRCFIAIRL